MQFDFHAVKKIIIYNSLDLIFNFLKKIKSEIRSKLLKKLHHIYYYSLFKKLKLRKIDEFNHLINILIK
jgi:hypothetical protein